MCSAERQGIKTPYFLVMQLGEWRWYVLGWETLTKCGEDHGFDLDELVGGSFEIRVLMEMQIPFRILV